MRIKRPPTVAKARRVLKRNSYDECFGWATIKTTNGHQWTRMIRDSCSFVFIRVHSWLSLIPQSDEYIRGNEPELYNLIRRSRNAFATTETELKLIAAAAMMGLRRIPKNG
jgi:hypothetical protein